MESVQCVPMDGLHSEILPPLRHNGDFEPEVEPVPLIQIVNVRRDQDQLHLQAFRSEECCHKETFLFSPSNSAPSPLLSYSFISVPITTR